MFNFTGFSIKISLANVAMFFVTIFSVNAQPGWVVGDFHQHTTFTDGSYSFFYMMQKNAQYKQDWWANSEHGGGFNRNGILSGYDLYYSKDSIGNIISRTTFWDSYSKANILGNVLSGKNPNMWRWQSLRDFSYPAIKIVRNLYPSKVVFQGYEWNVPGHEHCSFSTISEQFVPNDNANALFEFEYRFDASDKDTTGGLALGWTGKNFVNNHAKAVQAVTWLETNYKTTSWAVIAHPERKQPGKGGYEIKDFRDLNEAAPNVAFGFESVPGHQMGPDRGGYSATAVGGGTYGGSGYFSGKLGGLWDAMLSEGRHFWLFSNSDCHDTTTSTGSDFFPGEYQKNYTYVTDVKNPQAIVDGMRSGNTWVVNGDLIDSLGFTIETSTMGQTATVSGSSVNVTIKIHDPQTTNYNVWSSYTNPSVDHIDLIAGKLGNKIANTDPNYNVDDVTATTKVIARFDAVGGVTDSKGIVSQKWTDKGNGWKEMTMQVTLTSNMYFRLRGTNLGLNIPNETDAAGNPLADSLNGGPNGNTRAKAFADLWFYSNPIFVKSSLYSAVNDNDKPEMMFSVYPNPTSNSISVKCPTGSNVSIVNIDGKEIIAQLMPNDLNTINLENFSNGVYLVKIKYDGETFVEKIIKD